MHCQFVSRTCVLDPLSLCTVIYKRHSHSTWRVYVTSRKRNIYDNFLHQRILIRNVLCTKYIQKYLIIKCDLNKYRHHKFHTIDNELWKCPLLVISNFLNDDIIIFYDDIIISYCHYIIYCTHIKYSWLKFKNVLYN